jgi:carbon monoxide dehydrogenase subunit G
MELTNDFRVAVPPDTAWSVLTDVERIAPCLPGAQLQEVAGDEYRGVVKVKVGPITAQYKGAATFVEQDAAARKLVLKAEGRETRGQGNASATITATLAPDGDGTKVSVVTDLTVTGKVAQFGRGVMADVSAKLLGQFVERLETTVLAADAPAPAAAPAAEPEAPKAAEPAPAASEAAAPKASAPKAVAPKAAATAAAAPAEPVVRKIDSPEAEPIDLLGSAGSPVAKRIAPILAIVAVGWLLRVLLRRRKK